MSTTFVLLGWTGLLAHMFDLDYRHGNLDRMQFMAWHWQEIVDKLPPDVDQSARRAMLAIDWNVSMRAFNSRCDAYVAAVREPDPLKRHALAEACRNPRPLGCGAEDILREVTRAAVNMSTRYFR